MSPTAADRARDVLQSGYIGQGKVADEWEDALRQWFGVKHLAATNNATAAEHLLIYLLKRPRPEELWPGWSEKDEILCSPLSCSATMLPALVQGMRIKWVDVDRKSCNMSVDDLARKLSPTTKIIMPVLWGGMPLDMVRIDQLCDDALALYGFRPKVIYDCAHAMGSTYYGKPVCRQPGYFTYSFQAIKHVTSVEGGVAVVPDDKICRELKLARWYGLDREVTNQDFRCNQMLDLPGMKMNQVDPNAAVGLENLKDAYKIIGAHQDNAAYYHKALAGVPGISTLDTPSDRTSAWWIYTIYAERRDDLMRCLAEHGIKSSRVHERNDIYPAVREFRSILPELDWVAQRYLAIPVGIWVTPEDREFIVDTIKRGW
jgi:dTDP-4-amino-4,6-dideoxygalactose transaminase